VLKTNLSINTHISYWSTKYHRARIFIFKRTTWGNCTFCWRPRTLI